MTRYAFLIASFACCFIGGTAAPDAGSTSSRPNVIILFADDFGYGDVSCNVPGSNNTWTPHMDKLAASGVRFTDMHAGASVCTPSRAALLTGRLGIRTGVYQNFWTDALFGLPLDERTLAEYLLPAGYSTAMIGKWHLGTQGPYHPTFRGFQHYLGVPYSVDMGCTDVPGYNIPAEPPCPKDFEGQAGITVALPMYNASYNCSDRGSCNPFIVQQPVNLTSVTEEYANYATSYIASHGTNSPFFLYVAFAHTHVPLAHAPKWTNASKSRTVFADTVLELDDAVGRIVAAVDEAGIAGNTLIFATGDNGPWQVKCDLAGSPGPYIGAFQKNFGGGGTMKMTTWEGGHRVFGAAAWPGRIPAGIVSDALVSTLDFVPTILSQAGVALPVDRQYDGVDLSPILFGGAQTVRTSLYHPDGSGNLTAFRHNNYKLFWQTGSEPACNEPAGQTVVHNPPLVFDVTADPGESVPVTLAPDVLQAAIATWQSQMYNVSHTFRNIANYSEGGIPSSPCCNASHVLCRCTD